ncbi:hypothetical protein C8Q70DRAFT_213186 [Cubamyces menziesii]|nr:hypothetical protein C8Q70DRAFT_213186 [Cubamyces menziesii]
MYGFDPKDADSRYKRLAADTPNVTMGPMPVAAFMNQFLPALGSLVECMPSCEHAFDGIKAQNEHESDIYPILLKGLNSIESPRCPGYAFRDTSTRADELEGKLGSIKPDIICYAERYLEEVKPHKNKGTNEWAAMTRIAYAETFIEVKTNQTDDHYVDPPANTDRNDHYFVWGKSARRLGKDADRLKQYLGQNVAYATDMCARQHRRFCFSVSVSGCWARLIRWDRSGAIVSEAFDYVANPELLCEFFWRFAHLSDEQRGYDTTVQPATSAEETLFRDAIVEHIWTQIDCSDPAVLREVLDTHYMPGYVTLVSIPSTNFTPHLLVSRPIVTPLFFAGRCTRAYWAVNPDPTAEKKVVLLKDTWRLDGRGAEKEGKVLRDLQAVGVPNIPRVLYDGDVMKGNSSGQPAVDRTECFSCLRKYQWPCRRPLLRVKLVKRVHYRLVLDVAGFQLLSLYGTHELLHSTYDAFRALVSAFQLGRRLHRDVHPGNIILYNTSDTPTNPRTGFLVDWDNSCAVNGKQHLEDVYRPSLQWQFVAMDLLQEVRLKPSHDIVHDMESMLYVILYCGLTRLPLTKPSDPLTFRNIMHNMFDIACEYEDRFTGGPGKRANSAARMYTSSIIWKSPEIGEWINTVCDMHTPTEGTPSAEGTPPSQRQKWTPAHLDLFWRSFLQRHARELPRNDRMDNIAEYEGLSGLAPGLLMKIPKHATIASCEELSKPIPAAGPSSAVLPQSSASQATIPSSPASRATAPPSSLPSAQSDMDGYSESSEETIGRHSPFITVGSTRYRPPTPGPSAEARQPELRRSTRERKRPRRYMS